MHKGLISKHKKKTMKPAHKESFINPNLDV